MIGASEARRAHDEKLAMLHALRHEIDVDLAARLRTRARVQAQINEEIAFLARVRDLSRGTRRSLGELIEHARTPDPPKTKEGAA